MRATAWKTLKGYLAQRGKPSADLSVEYEDADPELSIYKYNVVGVYVYEVCIDELLTDGMLDKINVRLNEVLEKESETETEN